MHCAEWFEAWLLHIVQILGMNLFLEFCYNLEGYGKRQGSNERIWKGLPLNRGLIQFHGCCIGNKIILFSRLLRWQLNKFYWDQVHFFSTRTMLFERSLEGIVIYMVIRTILIVPGLWRPACISHEIRDSSNELEIAIDVTVFIPWCEQHSGWVSKEANNHLINIEQLVHPCLFFSLKANKCSWIKTKE